MTNNLSDDIIFRRKFHFFIPPCQRLNRSALFLNVFSCAGNQTPTTPQTQKSAVLLFIRLYLSAAYDADRAASATELLSCLYKCVCSCRRSTISSYENHNLLSGVAAMGNAFISFHKISFISPQKEYCFLLRMFQHNCRRNSLW